MKYKWMVRGRKKIKSALDQTVIFHSSEQAALLVNRKWEIQTNGRGGVWGSTSLRQNSEVGKVWLQDLPVPHSPPPPAPSVVLTWGHTGRDWVPPEAGFSLLYLPCRSEPAKLKKEEKNPSRAPVGSVGLPFQGLTGCSQVPLRGSVNALLLGHLPSSQCPCGKTDDLSPGVSAVGRNQRAG